MNDLHDNLGSFAYGIPVIGGLLCLATTGHSLSRGNKNLAGVFVAWFAAAFQISSMNPFLSSPTAFTLPDDIGGFLMFATLPVVPVILFYLFYKSVPTFQDYILKEVPAWKMIALQLYRIGGAAYLYLYVYGGLHNYVGLQTGILDIFIGLTSVPVAILVKKRGLRKTATLVKIWHAVGLYDLVSAFCLCGANFVGMYATDPSLAVFGFYPISLIVLFQVPLAMIIHFLFLTQGAFLLDDPNATFQYTTVN